MIAQPARLADSAYWWGAVGMSVVALAARGVDRWSWVVAAAGGVIGLAVPVRAAERGKTMEWCAGTAAGLAAFVLARSLWSSPLEAGRWAILVAVVTGVAEEALFRRGLYGLLERWGVLFAVTATSVVFGLVHVPVYGWGALPIDVAAGAVFGWQRWVSGSWTAPASTHALVNAFMYV